jgi:hypothetical protein
MMCATRSRAIIVSTRLHLVILTTLFCFDIGTDEKGVFGSSCHHVFHRHCILEWLKVTTLNDSCPNCRQPMWDPETYRLLSDEVLQQTYPSTPTLQEASDDETEAEGTGAEESGAGGTGNDESIV